MVRVINCEVSIFRFPSVFKNNGWGSGGYSVKYTSLLMIRYICLYHSYVKKCNNWFLFRFYISQGKKDKALASLTWLRGPFSSVEDEYLSLQRTQDKSCPEEEPSWLSWTDLKPLGICVGQQDEHQLNRSNQSKAFKQSKIKLFHILINLLLKLYFNDI